MGIDIHQQRYTWRLGIFLKCIFETVDNEKKTFKYRFRRKLRRKRGEEFTLTSSLTLSGTHERFTNKLIFEFTVLLVTIVLNAKQEKQEYTLI